MVANRLCSPESKLGVWDRWLETVHLPECNDLELRHMYEAMDIFHDHAEEIEREIFFQVANLLNLSVDIIFYDTTTASFAVDYEDEEEGGETAVLHYHRHNGDYRMNINAFFHYFRNNKIIFQFLDNEIKNQDRRRQSGRNGQGN